MPQLLRGQGAEEGRAASVCGCWRRPGYPSDAHRSRTRSWSASVPSEVICVCTVNQCLCESIACAYLKSTEVDVSGCAATCLGKPPHKSVPCQGCHLGQLFIGPSALHRCLVGRSSRRLALRCAASRLLRRVWARPRSGRRARASSSSSRRTTRSGRSSMSYWTEVASSTTTRLSVREKERDPLSPTLASSTLHGDGGPPSIPSHRCLPHR